MPSTRSSKASASPTRRKESPASVSPARRRRPSASTSPTRRKEPPPSDTETPTGKPDPVPVPGSTRSPRTISRTRSRPRTSSSSIPRQPKTVLPSPKDFFAFHALWCGLALTWAIGIAMSDAKGGNLTDSAFMLTWTIVGYHFSLNLLCNLKEWGELRKMWLYAVGLGVFLTWALYIQMNLLQTLVFPLESSSTRSVFVQSMYGIPTRAILWTIIPPFVCIYVGFLAHMHYRSEIAGYVGAALTTGILYPGSYNLSATFFAGGLGQFRNVLRIPFPEPYFLNDVHSPVFSILPRPPYLGHFPLYTILPSFALGAAVFEGYKVIKTQGSSLRWSLIVCAVVSQLYAGLLVSMYVLVEGA